MLLFLPAGRHEWEGWSYSYCIHSLWHSNYEATIRGAVLMVCMGLNRWQKPRRTPWHQQGPVRSHGLWCFNFWAPYSHFNPAPRSYILFFPRSKIHQSIVLSVLYVWKMFAWVLAPVFCTLCTQLSQALGIRVLVSGPHVSQLLAWCPGAVSLWEGLQLSWKAEVFSTQITRVVGGQYQSNNASLVCWSRLLRE